MDYKKCFCPKVNPQARRNKWHFILQCILLVVVVFIILLVLGRLLVNDILGAVGASALAATAFISFILPDSPVAKPRRVIGSYLIASLVGVVGTYAAKYIVSPGGEYFILVHQVAGALGVGLTVFFMILFDYEHPPAVGFGLGLIIDYWDHWTFFLVGTFILFIVFIAWLLRDWLVSMVAREYGRENQ